jgi:CheY-like chemotaxis protein
VYPHRHVNTVLTSASELERRRFLCWELGGEYPVLSASSVHDTLRYAEQTQPDAIVIDATPKGAAVLRALRTNPRTSRIPIVILILADETRQSRIVDRLAERYSHMAPTRVISRPVTPDHLREEVRRVLQVSVTSDRLQAGPRIKLGHARESDNDQRRPDISPTPEKYHRAAG